MNIGIVCYPTYGGSGVLATELGLGLADRGHNVHFITYKRPARLSPFHRNTFFHEVIASEYPLFDFTPYDSALTSMIYHVAKYHKLDLLHVHYAIPHATVAYLAREILKQQDIDLPVITTLHGTDITLVGTDPTFAPVVEFSINKSDGVTAVSNFLKSETLEKFNISREIRVIYNFIDLERFRQNDKNHFKKAIAPEGEKIISHVSNLRKVKRVDDVIRVFKRINDTMPSKLLLLGDGPERGHLESLVRELGIVSSVVFLGKQDAIEELLAVTDLFLMMSSTESFGLAALEAMACGVPVLATNVGGLPEVIEDGKQGFLCNVGDIDCMSEKAIQMLKDPALHEKMSEEALARAKEFDINKIIEEYFAYYCEILKRPCKHPNE